MNESVKELTLIISTIATVLGDVTALASEMRMRRRERIVSNPPENLDTFQSVRNS